MVYTWLRFIAYFISKLQNTNIYNTIKTKRSSNECREIPQIRWTTIIITGVSDIEVPKKTGDECIVASLVAFAGLPCELDHKFRNIVYEMTQCLSRIFGVQNVILASLAHA